MTQNAETPRLDPGALQEDSAAGGTSAATVPQGADDAHQVVALLIARPVPVQTSGRLEFAARCPSCSSWHRHVGLGEKDAPCGAHYLLEFKTKLKGAA
ncbi:hypothetical protein ACIOHS_12500 [Streptomyces sp. NPDC088253]|uniref:hypothetical protein n=1 Tax=Streptomyces sp. NPDC088253 TaxID=3365846 RepID=UPI0038095F00